MTIIFKEIFEILVFSYHSMTTSSLKHLGKHKMHWFRPFSVIYIISTGEIKLTKLSGLPLKGLVNGRKLKVYYDPKCLRCCKLDLSFNVEVVKSMVGLMVELMFLWA